MTFLYVFYDLNEVPLTIFDHSSFGQSAPRDEQMQVRLSLLSNLSTCMYRCIQIYIYHVRVCKCIKAEKSQTDDSKAYVHFKGGDGDAGGRG